MSPSLSQRILQTAGLFQALVAAPTMLVMGGTVFDYLFNYDNYRDIYPFITATFNALMSAIIVFIILIQRYPIKSYIIRLYLEITKSVCATAVWLWLLLDSIFKDHNYSYKPPPDRTPRIQSAALSVVVLLFLFYPSLVFAVFEESIEGADGERGDGDGVERTPLLAA